MNPSRKRILLGQLASNGDCLYATTIARQIKVDYPGCHLTWAVGSRWRSIIDGNPDVDEVWEIPYYTQAGNLDQWQRFEREVGERKNRGDFDEVFLTQISLSNFHFWVGSIRASIFRAYPHPITVDTAPVLRLSVEEVSRVQKFAAQHRLAEKSQVILFECAPQSLQSLVTPQFALDIAQKIVAKHHDVALILSSNHPFAAAPENVIDGSVLSLRENAELTKYCSLLVGASSGVTWIATSDWAKPLPTLQLLVADLTASNSPIGDFEERNADTSGIIEMHRYCAENVVACIDEILERGFAQAKSKFHQPTPFKFAHFNGIQAILLRRGRWKQSMQFLSLNLNQYGFKLQFFFFPALLTIKMLGLIFSGTISKLKHLFSA